jgi:adenine deaminase
MMIEKLIQDIPKAELHLHIEGTLSPEMLFQKAKAHSLKLPYKTLEEVHKAYHFHDLQSFLDLYYAGMEVLKTQEDFYDLTWAYLTQAAAQNVRHTEIFFDPQAHTSRGITFDTVIQGIHQALQDGATKLGVTSRLILCFLRDQTAESAMATLEQALPFKEWIVAVGLDSAEKQNPPSKFQAVFDKARANGFLTVAHAGEEGPAEYITQALDLLHVSRVDHGVRCMEDGTLVARLVAQKIPLTVCPLSNINLHVYKTMSDHPIKRMLEAGLVVTINSDDPAYLGGGITKNFLAAHKTFSFSQQQIYQLAKNSFQASFLSPEEKKRYLVELGQFYKTATSTD